MDTNYTRLFREKLGFTNKQTLQKYFKATDFIVVNWEKIEKCNFRLTEIFCKLNDAVSEDIKQKDIEKFCLKIKNAFCIMRDNEIIPQLTNQGRDPSDVYYNWMRGYLVCEFFTPAIAKLFCVKESAISAVGQDDLKNIETFKRAATADLELTLNCTKKIRLEIQAGYTGVNDIKRSKIIEAEHRLKENNLESLVIHFDIFNGLAAVINISKFYKIPNNDYHKAFENTDVLTIKETWFKWKLAEKLKPVSELIISYE